MPYLSDSSELEQSRVQDHQKYLGTQDGEEQLDSQDVDKDRE